MITFYPADGLPCVVRALHSSCKTITRISTTMRMNESEKRPRRAPAAPPARTPAKKTPRRQPNGYPGDEEIRVRAYTYYVERDGAPGDPVADWLRAEHELTMERARTRKRA